MRTDGGIRSAWRNRDLRVLMLGLSVSSIGDWLYGIALVYGATGSTSLSVIAERMAVLGPGTISPLMLAGIAFLIVGFGFKVATVPFHMWAPDVYDGAPSAVTAFMAATVKAAAFASFLRVWLEAFPGAYGAWHGTLAALAITTMIVGNAIGLAQRNLKRLLAYSSIGHAGYLLVAIAPGTLQGASAMLFYLLVYTLATFGAFAVIITMTRPGRNTVMIDELSGLWATRPWLASAMAVIMLALLGFPIFGGGGFFAKWYVIRAALQAPQLEAPPLMAEAQAANTSALVAVSSPIITPMSAMIPGAGRAEIVAGAGHFLQEDKGEEIGAITRARTSARMLARSGHMYSADSSSRRSGSAIVARSASTASGLFDSTPITARSTPSAFMCGTP
mgnify:CR=1 FL=1